MMKVDKKSVVDAGLRSFAAACATSAFAVGMAVNPAFAAETPQSRYAMNSYCEVITSSGISIPGHPANQLAGLTKLYAERTATSGKAAGMTPHQIAADVARTRANVAHQWAAAAARPHLVKQTEACAALPFFEAVDAIKGKNG